MTEYQLHTQGASHGLAPAYDGRDPMRNRPLIYGTDTSMIITRYGLGREAISDRDQRGVTLPGITRQVDGEYVRHDDHIAIISELQAEMAGLEIMVAAQADTITEARRLQAACEAHNEMLLGRLKLAEGAPVTAHALWCMHILGPDDIHAAPSRAHAEKAVGLFNARFGPISEVSDVMCKAVVAPWPHSAESHAASVDKFIIGWITPQSPTSTQISAPDGWMLVPIDITPLMLATAHETAYDTRALPWQEAEKARYKRMLEAAPTPSADRQAQQEVRCNWCYWTGEDDDLASAIAIDEPDDGPASVCPRCKQIGYLMDLEPTQQDADKVDAQPVGYFQNVNSMNGLPPQYEQVAAVAKSEDDVFPLYRAPVAAQPAEPVNSSPVDWHDAQQIADLPEVDELLQGFAEDPTGDAGTMIVRAVMQAVRQESEPAMAGDELPEPIGHVAAKNGEPIGLTWFRGRGHSIPDNYVPVYSANQMHKRVQPASGEDAVAKMVHAMFRSGNGIPVARIAISREQYDAAMQQGGKP